MAKKNSKRRLRCDICKSFVKPDSLCEKCEHRNQPTYAQAIQAPPPAVADEEMVVEGNVANPIEPTFQLVDEDFPPLRRDDFPVTESMVVAEVSAGTSGESFVPSANVELSNDEVSNGGPAIGAEVAAETPPDVMETEEANTSIQLSPGQNRFSLLESVEMDGNIIPRVSAPRERAAVTARELRVSFYRK